ncbi:hypothetical protein A2U01_0118684, partial [Trifolium medium]|nr:hypothetical protein [Trifolium medium]
MSLLGHDGTVGGSSTLDSEKPY